MGRVHCGIYRGLNCIKYIIHGFTSSTILLSSLPQFMEQFQQIIFLHLHTCVNSICTIFTLLPLFLPLSPWEGLVSLFCSWFCRSVKIKRKTWHFCLFETQGVSIWYFHVYRYYTANWLSPLVFFIPPKSLFCGGFSPFKISI
jgi:hypothetical protein